MKWSNIVRFSLEERVDERRDGGALSQNQQHAQRRASVIRMGVNHQRLLLQKKENSCPAVLKR